MAIVIFMVEQEAARGSAGVLRMYLIALPDYLPVAHGSTWGQDVDKAETSLNCLEKVPLAGLAPVSPPRGEPPANATNFVSLRFWQVRDDYARLPEIAKVGVLMDRVVSSLTDKAPATEPAVPDDHQPCRTVVEAVTYVAPDDGEGPEDEALTRCIDVVLAYHRAFRLSTDARVPELTYERIHPVTLRLERPLESDEETKPVLMGATLLNHMNVPAANAWVMDAKTQAEFIQWYVRAKFGDPFVLFAERRQDAKVEAFTHGRPGESIVQCAIAAEVLFDALLGLLLWEESLEEKTSVEGASEIFSSDLTPRLRNQYAPRLGGQWALAGDNLGGWEASIATIRNRVVHSGYRPSQPEVAAALQALYDLERFVGDRLAERWRRYPRAAWLYLGSPGFERRGQLAKATEWIATQGSDVSSTQLRWIHEYRAWRQQVDAGISRRRRSRRGR